MKYEIKPYEGDFEEVTAAGLWRNVKEKQLELWLPVPSSELVLRTHLPENAYGLVRDGWHKLSEFLSIPAMEEHIDQWLAKANAEKYCQLKM